MSHDEHQASHNGSVQGPLIIINIVVAVLYVIIASMANRFLLKKDEKLRLEQVFGKKVPTAPNVVGRGGPPGLSAIEKSHAGGALAIPRSNVSDSGRATPSNNSIAQPPLPATPVRSNNAATEDTNLLTPRSRRRALALSVSRPKCKIFSDYSCIFFILIICFCLSRAVQILLITTTLTKQTIDMTADGRKLQDYESLIPALLFYTVFIVLFHAMFYICDTSRQKSARTYRLRLAVMLFVCYAAMFTGLVLSAFGKSSTILEYVSCSIDLMLSVCYAFAAFYLPRSLKCYGALTEEISGKVLKVSILVSVSTLLRGVLLLPDLQTELSHVLHTYTLTALMCFEFFPVVLSIRTLHGSARPRTDGATGEA